MFPLWFQKLILGLCGLDPRDAQQCVISCLSRGGIQRGRLFLCCFYSTRRKVYALPVEPLTEELVSPGARNAYSPRGRLAASLIL
jgi:hypothetical protein